MAREIGTLSILFTDIEGSTHLLQHLGDSEYANVLTDHRRLLRAAFTARGGHELETQGDGFLFTFPRAKEALLAAVDAQRAMLGHQWPGGVSLRVRMGLHTGEPVAGPDGYVGVDLHRAARICSAGHGGQILISEATRLLVEDGLPEGETLRDLGEHRLKDLARPHRLFQIVTHDLPADFPPLKSLNALPNNLPLQLSSFIGREREIAEIKRLLSTTRLLTLTGPGGAGKTRLALQVAAEILEDFKDGVWLVELASLSDPALVPQTVASALRIREQPGRAILAALTDFLLPKQLLLVLDNSEHLIEACAQLANALLRACPSLRILATSRERLAVPGETIWQVPPLSLPDPQRLPPVERLLDYEAVRLFAERARSTLPTFTLADQNTRPVVRICTQLDGLPLAIELAAARVNALSVGQIAEHLGARFQLLTAGDRKSVV